MESAAKRKAGSAASPENDRATKRQKATDDADDTVDSITGETVQSTTTMGLKFIESLRNAKDKTGRPIATHFLQLPDKSEIPEYYEAIKVPISLATMEAKLKRGEFATLAQLEGSCKRLVLNAKYFNDKKSLVFEDAERLRKTASNWMTKNNPAYRLIPGYTAIPTPVPGEEPHVPGRPHPRPAPPKAPATPTPAAAAASTPNMDTTERPRRAAAQPATPAPSKLRQSAASPVDDGGPEFDGKSFQQAQEQIVREMIDYTDQGLQIFLPFLNLPNRALKDYYQVIKSPMSLSAVKKKVQGVVGRAPPTNHSLYTNWDGLERDMKLIWENAREYNEDGSDIYNLSIEFEEIFKKRLEEAKAKVNEPPQPPQQKIKINMAAAPPKQQLKIKLGRQSPASDPNTPAGRSSATPGFIVDNEALLRQQRHVQESMNGNRSSRPSSSGKAQTPLTANPFTGPQGTSSTIAPPGIPLTKTAGSPAAAPNGIKTDVQSPALNAIQPATATTNTQRLSVPAQTPTMAPPQSTSRPSSGSPHPSSQVGQQPGSYHPPQFSAPNYYVPPQPQFDIFRKTPLKSVNEALIPKITLTTSPMLNPSRPLHRTIFANRYKTCASYTLTLAHGQSYMHIVPQLPVALTNRAYRAFVSINGARIMESSRVPVTAGINGSTASTASTASNGPSTPGGFEGGKKKGEPLYEAKLVAGLNRIEVEVIAERDRAGKPAPVDGKDAAKELVDVEKFTVFAHLPGL